MNGLEIIILLIIASICGAIAQLVAGYSPGGLLVSMVLGFIGALLGAWIARATQLPELWVVQVGEQPFPVLWSIIGGALFVAILGALTGRPAARYPAA